MQLCLFCQGTGIDLENSYPAEGPSYYSMGEPPVLEPCICQYLDDPCDCIGLTHDNSCVNWVLPY